MEQPQPVVLVHVRPGLEGVPVELHGEAAEERWFASRHGRPVWRDWACRWARASSGSGSSSSPRETSIRVVRPMTRTSRLGAEHPGCPRPAGHEQVEQDEHRLCCHITHNWRGRPLVSREVVVSLIGSTRTAKGLRVRAALDDSDYETGVRISDQEFAAIPIRRDAFRGDWNYTIAGR